MAMLARSFAVQGSFNYRTLIGAGFAFVVLPALRITFRDRPDELEEAVRRHQEPFNSHPYLVGVAAGAVVRLEEDGAPAPVLERFKSALRGSLGSIGDALFWAGFRPACVLLALVLVMTRVPFWFAVLTFLVLYNTAHVATRAWGFRLGLRHGASVAAGLRESPLLRAWRAAAITGAFLLGTLSLLVAAGRLTEEPGPYSTLAATIAVGAGIALGPAIRLPAVIILALLILAGIVRGALS
jgi:PTS system mannose-specific IID component